MKSIPLTQGEYALIDDEDFELISGFRWRILKSRGTNYARTGHRKHISMHRLIMNAKNDQKIDHRNRKGLDNRRCNLRFATHSQNQQNSISVMNSTSKYKGVSWILPGRKGGKKGQWRASIKKDGIAYHLGQYTNESIAAWAYDQMAKRLFGEYANTNLS